MKKFVIKVLVLFLAAVIALYLASFFHFFGPSMWSKGAIPESWTITTKFVAAYTIFILLYIFISTKIKNRLAATAISTLSIGLLLPWIGYSVLSVLSVGTGGSSYTSYAGQLMSLVSDILLLVLVFLGRKFMIDNIKVSK